MMHILLAIDGSPFSEAAGDLLRRIPMPSTPELTLLAVMDKLDDADPEARQEWQQTLRDSAQQLLTQEAERFTAVGWTPHTMLREGHAAHEIVEAAGETSADLIAVGSRGLGSVKRFLLGSVSEKVMAYAPCSVLIARQPQDRDPEDTALRLLLAFDGSPTAAAAVETIASLPLQAHTHILITTVMELLTYYRMDIIQTTSPSWQAKKQAAQADLEQAAQVLRQATPNVSVELREGNDTSQEILDAATTFNAELIVMGHKGKSGLERFLLGSVANQVVHHAPCSVWIMRQ
jgi:nucleotide-binding universal stress UspA family protein